MSIPGARKINIDGIIFNYKVRGIKSRFTGDSGPEITVIIQLKNNKYLTQTFLSKLWDEDLHNDYLGGHKNSFTTKDVKNTIKCYLENGKILDNFETSQWIAI